MKSVWTSNSSLPKFNSLDNDIKTDVLIIGGGITGILCAYFLHKQGVNYILVEGSEICSGTTKNTTAKLTVQHGLNYSKILKIMGKERAKMYFDVNQLALEKYKELCGNIECDFELKDNYVYSIDNEKKIQQELEALNKIGINAEYADKLELPITNFGAVKFKNQAQFNPLTFISEIASGLNIYENTFVKELKDNCAVTENGKIFADNIIAATHFPFINKHGGYFVKLYQHRSYVIALENAQNVNGMYVDESKTGLSFRNYRDLLLLGGGSHRTGKQGGNWKELRNTASSFYPKSKEVYYWAAQDCMSLDDVPYIGKYSKATNNFYVASGFNKWGMTGSMVSAMLLSDMVTGKRNEYAEVFNPSRSILKPQLFVNAFEATINLVNFSKKRCPHLGCALKWNEAERTWDCPCHGSRFTKEGSLIDNPASGDLKSM